MNLIRGLAAVAVLFGHLRELFFCDFKAVGELNPAVALYYSLTGLGHQAVMVFFVLSGFFVAGSAIRLVKQWSWQVYLANRLTRLYLVLIPALALTALLDQVSMRLPLGPAYFYNFLKQFDAEPLAAAISVQGMLANLTFLQTVAARPFGSNMALWSLANEFWYYILFPFILIAVQPRLRVIRIATMGAVLALAAYFLRDIVFEFPIWLFGAAMHVVPRLKLRRLPLATLRASSFGVFAIALGLARLHKMTELPSDYCVGLSFSVWLYLLLADTVEQESKAAWKQSYSSFAALLAGCSYSIYAIHLPVLFLIRSALVAAPWQPTISYLSVGLVMGLSIIAIGYFFSQVTEAKTDAVRRLVQPWIIAQTARLTGLAYALPFPRRHAVRAHAK